MLIGRVKEMSACCHAQWVTFIDQIIQAYGPFCCACGKECTVIDDPSNERITGNFFPPDYKECTEYFRNRFPITE